MPVNSYRDYDLLSNKYKELHDDKVLLNTQIQKLNSAKQYWERTPYNPVLAKFNDETKESEYQKKIQEKNKNLSENPNKILNRNAKGYDINS